MQLLKMTQVFCTIGSMPIAPPINTTNQHHDTPPRFTTTARTLVEKGSSTGPSHGFRGRLDFPLVPNVHRLVHDVVQPRRDSPNRVLFVHRSSGTNPQNHSVDGTFPPSSDGVGGSRWLHEAGALLAEVATRCNLPGRQNTANLVDGVEGDFAGSNGQTRDRFGQRASGVVFVVDPDQFHRFS